MQVQQQGRNIQRNDYVMRWKLVTFCDVLMKEDDTVKEPYTDAEIARLLQKPKTNRWVEWRNWALVNYFVATGNRASTVVNLRVKDIDFEKMTIFLAKVKNRR